MPSLTPKFKSAVDLKEEPKEEKESGSLSDDCSWATAQEPIPEPKTLEEARAAVYEVCKKGDIEAVKKLLPTLRGFEAALVKRPAGSDFANQLSNFWHVLGWRFEGRQGADLGDVPCNRYARALWSALKNEAKSSKPEFKAFWNAHQHKKTDPFEVALKHGHFEVLELLLHHGRALAALPADAHDALVYLAAQTGNLPQLDRLLAQKPSAANAQAPGGWTPLHMAVLHGHLNTANYLLDAGAKLDQVAGTMNWTSVHIAARELAQCPAPHIEFEPRLALLRFLLGHPNQKPHCLDLMTGDGWSARSVLENQACWSRVVAQNEPMPTLGRRRASSTTFYSDDSYSEASVTCSGLAPFGTGSFPDFSSELGSWSRVSPRSSAGQRGIFGEVTSNSPHQGRG